METKSKGRRLIKWSLSVAATILVLFTTFYTKSYIENNSRSSLMLESTTPYGVKSKITLPDGTLVYLNAGTTLKYPSHFSKQRVVNLTGEAYFEVFKDSKHPFWVETKGVKIKVLGTHFNVKAYENENSIETTLLEGSVGLYRGTVNDEVLVNILKPNQQAVLVKNSGEIKVNSIDANLVNAWKDGKFYFENMDFVGIAKVLERNYNVKIEIRSEELQKKKFFGIFLQNRSVYQMLDIMGIKEDFKYKRSRDTIYIY
ncbi:MAG: DUF4974 domain-containing protein [Chloroflexia bacterium]|nr:DUF4974 domain-containing protein [Chloroflexia bacterium]